MRLSGGRKHCRGQRWYVSSEGTIVPANHADAQTYMGEFFDENDKTIAVCEVVDDEYLELKWAYGDTT